MDFHPVAVVLQLDTTHITQNNTTIKRNTVHKTTHTINTLHRIKIQQSQLHGIYLFHTLTSMITFYINVTDIHKEQLVLISEETVVKQSHECNTI
jgi:hypothetical protein